MKKALVPNQGVTLIELLAALMITVLMSSVILYTIRFESDSWNNIVPASNVRSNAIFILGKLQTTFQNIKAVDPKSSSPTLLVATDALGNNVQISIQQKEILVTDTLANGNVKALIQNAAFKFNDTVFTGTNFTVNGPSVKITLVATPGNDVVPSKHAYQVTQVFTVGGGN